MGMSIEEAHGILSNGLANAPSEHEWCVAFKVAIDTMRKYQQLQADYENRLKADLVAMLTEIDMELDELTPPEFSTNYYSHGIIDAQVIIQKKIDTLKEA